MKKLLFILALAVTALTARAQTVTNITYKVTVDVIVTGVSTNSANASLNLVYASGKSDSIRIDGLASAFSTYRTGGGTNAFEAWLKQDVKDRASDYAAAKQRADNAATLAKLTILLQTEADLLSAADLSNLATIAAKAQ